MKKKSLLLSSLAMLVVAVLAFTGATYAWFVTGRAPSIEQIDVGVTEASVVQLGAIKSTAAPAPTSSDYFFNLELAKLKAAETADTGFYYNPYNATPDPIPLEPVTPHAVTASKPTFKPAFDSAGATGSFAPETAGPIDFDGETDSATSIALPLGSYIAFDVFFINLHTTKNANVGVDLGIPSVAPVAPATDYAYAADEKGSKVYCDPGAFYWTDLSEAQKQVVKSVRVAFITYDAQPGSTNTNKSVSGIKVWDPWKGVTLTSDITQGVSGTETQWAGNTKPIGYTDDNVAAGVNPKYPSSPSTKSILHLFEIDKFDTAALGNAGWAKSTRLTVVIWIEGNDTDCVTAVAGGGFSISLKFATEILSATP